MTHGLLMVAFSSGVGLVLGLILRRDPAAALRLSAVIAGSMGLGAVLIAWVLYLLPV